MYSMISFFLFSQFIDAGQLSSIINTNGPDLDKIEAGLYIGLANANIIKDTISIL